LSIHCVPSIRKLEVYECGCKKFLLLSRSEAMKLGLPEEQNAHDLFLIPLEEIPEFRKYLDL